MKVRIVKSILWFVLGLAAVVGIARFWRGLGPTSALSDITPWGFWIGFDVVCGVALAAGGFVIAAAVYVFKRESYHSIARPAVLTAFLGYAAVVVGLLFDLGLPWNIWHMIIYWQPHSALFEVGWCVMLYLTVLTLEFCPVVLEKTPFHKLYNFTKKLTLPLVILGIALSTLHQSSLGTLFMIMPFRIHALWYSSIQPLLFLVSAVSLGLGMVCLESLLSSWLYDRKPEMHILKGLGKAAVWVLGIYFIIRMGDIIVSGNFGLIFAGTWESSLFLLEICMIVVLPIILFANPRSRSTLAGIGFGATSIVLGIILNRLTVSGLATLTPTGSAYVPSWMEFTISAGVVSGATLVFLFFVERFKVYEEEMVQPEAPDAMPDVDPVSNVRLDAPWYPAWRQYSLAFIVACSLAFALLPKDVIGGAQPLPVPLDGPRLAYANVSLGADGRTAQYTLADEMDATSPAGKQLEVLILDADRNGKYVLFTHELHKARNGGNDGCSKCHHMNKPLDRATSCYLCHSDMYSPTDTFDHDLHADRFGGNDGCIECHTDPAAVKSRATVTECIECHDDMRAPESFIKTGLTGVAGIAPPYKDSLHALCIECHKTLPGDTGLALTQCRACHHEMNTLPCQPAAAPSGNSDSAGTQATEGQGE